MKILTTEELISHCNRQLSRLPSGSVIFQEHESVRTHLQMLQHYVDVGTVKEFRAAIRRADKYENVMHGGPCALCRFSPPSSCDGKPCSMCPADAASQAEGY